MSKNLALLERAKATTRTYEELYRDFEFQGRIKNLSKFTQEYYTQSLKHFERFLINENVVLLDSIDKHLSDRFIMWLQEQYDNPITINTYLRATRALLYYAMEQELIPNFKIQLLKQEDKVKEAYSDSDIQKLLKRPNLKNCSFDEYRDWVLVQYLLDTGNHLNTVINLKVQDVDFFNGLVVLTTTKNKKQTFSPVSHSLNKVLLEYVRTWRLRQESHLFTDTNGKQLNRNTIQYAIYRYNKSRGVEKTSIHLFRHTFAKNYILNGGQSLKLQKLLGHSSIQMTQKYVNLFGNDLAQDFDKYSIVEKFSSGEKLKRQI